jgi:tetratricopeptide (TPR) repeat protein
MNTPKDEIIEKFLKLQGNRPEPIETRRELVSVIEQLDEIYWSEVERIFVNALHQDEHRLFLNKYERVIVDTGYVDDRLVDNPQELKIKLLKELYFESKPNHFYLSQWLNERLRTFIVYGELGIDKKPTLEVGLRGDTKAIYMGRQAIYLKLEHLFRNLPGFSEKAIEAFLSGRLDELIETLESFPAGEDQEKKWQQKRDLVVFRDKLISQARERAKTDEEFLQFDNLRKLDKALEQKRRETGIAVIPRQTLEEVSLDKKLDFLNGELKLIRSLLKLGIAGSGITRTHSVLTSGKKRMTKEDIKTIINSVKEADPTIPDRLNILVAPYVGLGFFEWDRGTIFLPLISTRSEEESIVTGFANYRIMGDALQDNGRLRHLYETKLGRKDFREGFIKDYKNWVLGIGKGYKGALDPDTYNFFKRYIGPSQDNLFAVSEILNISSAERAKLIKECREKLNKGEGGFNEHYMLGILYWKENRSSEALSEIARAVKENPTDGRALYTLGFQCELAGIFDKAKSAYEEILNVAPNTIWHVYASDALEKFR